MEQQTRWNGRSVWTPVAREAFRSGTIAALAMIPFALFFRTLGWRINEYGIRVVHVLFGALPNTAQFGLFVLEHFIISWSAAVPLLVLLTVLHGRVSGLLVGVLYGGGFYVIVNSLALPVLFGDTTPWALGFRTVIAPSLVVHIVYGLSIALTSRTLVERLGQDVASG